MEWQDFFTVWLVVWVVTAKLKGGETVAQLKRIADALERAEQRATGKRPPDRP